MKRLIAILCAVVLAAAMFTACGNNNKNIPDANELLSSLAEALGSAADTIESEVESALDTDDNITTSSDDTTSSTADAQTTVINENEGDVTGKGTVSDGVKVEGIPYFTDYSKYVYLLITSDKDCDLSISMDFFKDGKIVGTTSSSVDAVAKGVTVCEDFYCDEEFNSYEYKVVASDVDYYVPVDQNLTLDVSMLSNKVIVSLTNNGKIPAKYVWYDVFFYKNGQLVEHNYSYCEDDDSEIKVGATERSECSCYADGGFDDAKVYFHGEGYKD